MSSFTLNKISKLEEKSQNRVESALLEGGYSNKKAEYLMYQEEGTDEAFRVVFGER